MPIFEYRRRRRRWSPERLTKLCILLNDGKRVDEILDIVGGSKSNLYLTINNKLVLEPETKTYMIRDATNALAFQPTELTVVLPHSTATYFTQLSERLGKTRQELVLDLLKVIADDNLHSAIMDD